jgi:hypothetical protein
MTEFLSFAILNMKEVGILDNYLWIKLDNTLVTK